MGTSERRLLLAWFTWVCKWSLLLVCGGGLFTVDLVCSARIPPRPTSCGERVSGDLTDSTRQLVRDTALLFSRD